MPRTALITGAAGGIGTSLCKEFKDVGYKVIGLDLPNTVMPDSCTATIHADLESLCNSRDYLQDTISQVKLHLSDDPLKVLVNNAAIQITDSAEQLTPTQWHKSLDINLLAPFLLTQSLLNELVAAQGSVVNMVSIHAILTKASFVCYATSKAALVGLTKSLSVEFGGRVRVNALAPAAIETPMLREGFKNREAELAQLSKMHPIGRIGTAQEVAQSAVFLASDQASFITGAVLDLNGAIGNRLYDPG